MAKEKEKEVSVGSSELATALVAAIEAARPPTKKNSFNRKIQTPWTPKDGAPKSKLKRKMYQHGLLLDAEMLANEDVDLLNKLRPGVFLDGFVRVVRRRDRGVDISYPIKTASQRLRLVNSFGIRNLKELLERCIYEAANPKPKDLEDLE